MVRSLSVFLFSFGVSAFAQTNAAILTGTVVDPSGAVVSGAEIRLYSRDNAFQRATRSSSLGAFRLESLPAGEYLAEARTNGLDQVNPRTITLRGGETMNLTLELQVAGVAERVSVTASSTAQGTMEIAKGSDVLDGPSLDRRAEFSFVESLRVVPGLRVQQLGGPGSFARILTRGLRATDTSVLIDGMRFRDAGSVQGDAAAYLGDLMVINSDRVEVLRGSGSSLYGTHAMAGVVNMVTDAGGGPVHGEVSAEGGGLGLGRGLARMAGGLKEDRFQYSGGLTHLNVSNGTEGVERVRNWSGQGFAQYRFSPKTSLSARVYGTTVMNAVQSTPQAAPAANLPTTPMVPAVPLAPDQVARADQGLPYSWGNATFAPNLFDPDRRRVADFVSGMLTWTQQITPRASYRVSYQTLGSNRQDLNGPGGAGFQSRFNTLSGFQGKIDTVLVRTDLFASRAHLISAGYEFEREDYRNPSSDQNPNLAQQVNAETRAVQQSNTAFVQDQMKFFGDRLQISLSGRFQGFSLDRPTFTGNAPPYSGAAFQAPPNALTGDAAIAWLIPSTATKFRAHAGNAYRAPALYERFGAYFFLGGFTAIGDPRLSPERSIGVDAGIDQYLANNRLRVSASYFYTRLQQVIGFGSLSGDPYGRFSGYVNVGGGLARGVELSGEARLSRTTLLQAAYTYTNADNRRSDLIGGALQAIRVFPHMFTFVASQQITKRIQVTADFLGASDYVAGTFFVGGGNRPYLFPGPHKLDASVQYTVPLTETRNLRFYTRIENLLNQRYFEDGYRTPKIWAVAGVKFMF